MKDMLNLNVNDISFEESLRLYRDFSAKSKEYTYIPPINAENKDFGSDFPGSLIQKPRYTNCRFHLSRFKASNGAFSFFKDCRFYDCYFHGSNFKYCNIKDSKFIKKQQFNIENTGFTFGYFSNVLFDGINFEGISFRDIELKDSCFNNCIINDSSFERAIISNTTFKNMDLRNIGIRYCQFNNVSFENVVFPILDLANNIGLFEIFESQQNNVKFSLGYQRKVSFQEAKKLSLYLIPYYQETRQYFCILNIYLLNEKFDDILPLLKTAIDYSIEQCDFDTLYNICKLVADCNLYDNTFLVEFYHRVKNSINPNKFPYNIQKGYIHYMDEIKNILIDNPHGYPQINIELLTNISSKEPEKLTPLIKEIENIIYSVNSNISPCIQISHHSPYEIIISAFGHLTEILMICQIFYYSFGGLKSLNDLKNSRYGKATNNNKSDKKSDKTNKNHKEKYTKTEFSIGPIHFTRETTSLVNSVEYYITD